MIILLLCWKNLKDYDDCAIGTAIITSWPDKEIDYVPCEIRYGRCPNKGGYSLCLVLDISAYVKYGDDKFGIDKINLNDNTNDSVICKMLGYIRRREDKFGTNEIVVEVWAGWERLMSSGVVINSNDQESDGGVDEGIESNNLLESAELVESKNIKTEDIKTRKHWWNFW